MAARTEKTDLQLLTPFDVTPFVVPADPEGAYPEEHFAIGKFSFIKSLMVLESLGELAKKVDIGSIFTGQSIELDFLIDKLPVLLVTMRPAITRILALTLIKNSELEALAEDPGALDGRIAVTKRAVYRLDTAKAAELLKITIERIGIQDIKQNFPALLSALKAS